MSIAAWGEWHRNVWHSHAATLINASSRLTVTLGGYTCLHCWSMMFAKDVSRSYIIQLGSNIIMTNCEKLWKQDLYTCKNPEPIQLVMYGDLRYRMVLNLYTPNLVSTYPQCARPLTSIPISVILRQNQCKQSKGHDNQLHWFPRQTKMRCGFEPAVGKLGRQKISTEFCLERHPIVNFRYDIYI